jgi:hypothetical protein
VGCITGVVATMIKPTQMRLTDQDKERIAFIRSILKTRCPTNTAAVQLALEWFAAQLKEARQA